MIHIYIHSFIFFFVVDSDKAQLILLIFARRPLLHQLKRPLGVTITRTFVFFIAKQLSSGIVVSWKCGLTV